MASIINVVIAIDIGTCYSGYAFSFGDEFQKIYTGYNVGGKLSVGKVPTSVLCDPSKKFYAFGYDAEDKYSELLLSEEADGWSLFSEFKMILYNNDDLSESTPIMDITGTVSMPAIDIFAMAIRYMKDRAMVNVIDTIGPNMTDSEIYYVINVPAIWDYTARQFMRKAAARADILESNMDLIIASEAASILSQELVLTTLSGEQRNVSGNGSKNMVVDLGGGTADVTVHETLSDGKLRELHKPSGGDWGDKQVDGAFLKLLEDALGRETVEAFKTECAADFLDMMHEFKKKKRIVGEKSETRLNVRLNFALDDTKKNATKFFIESLRRLNTSHGISIEEDNIRVEAETARALFKHTVDGIREEIQSILTKMDELNAIIIVGGFSESPIVRDTFLSLLKDRNIDLLSPSEPILSVLRGAVLYGRTPEILE